MAAAPGAGGVGLAGGQRVRCGLCTIAAAQAPSAGNPSPPGDGMPPARIDDIAMPVLHAVAYDSDVPADAKLDPDFAAALERVLTVHRERTAARLKRWARDLGDVSPHKLWFGVERSPTAGYGATIKWAGVPCRRKRRPDGYRLERRVDVFMFRLATEIPRLTLEPCLAGCSEARVQPYPATSS